MENFLQYGITGAVITLLLYYLDKKSKTEPREDEQGHKILRLPKAYGIVGIIGGVMGLAGTIAGIMKFGLSSIWSLALVALMVGGLAIPLILMAFVYEIKITGEGIEQKNMFGKHKFLNWNDIKTAKFSSLTMELKISDGEKKIKCHQHLIGFDILVNQLSARKGWSKMYMEIP